MDGRLYSRRLHRYDPQDSVGVFVMNPASEFAASDAAFGEAMLTLRRLIDPTVRLPNWPFLASSGFVTIYEFDRFLGGDFGKVLQSLAVAFGDDTVTVVGLDPPADYYRNGYGFLPAFWSAGNSFADAYGEALRYEPGGDATGAMAFSINVLGIVGSSGSWSAWGQRDWEIGLVFAREANGPWLEQGVPWFGRDVDLDSIRSPAGWGIALSDADRSEFWRNVREHSSGQ